MKHLKSFNVGIGRKIELESNRTHRKITFDVIDGRIRNIDNQSGVRFGYQDGQPFNRNIETWCCNNNFTMDGEDMCPEEKLMGMKLSDIPQGHPLRLAYPGKFRK